MIKVYARAFGLGGDPIDQAADGQLAQVLSYMDDVLSRAPYLVDDSFSAADIQMSFIPENAQTLVPIGGYRNIVGWLERLHGRSEEHTSELQSLMRISYAVFCLKKKKK